MRWGRAGLAVAALLAPVVVSACGGGGGGASANMGDPVSVTRAYLDAIKSDPGGGQQYLASETTEKLTGSTNLSRWLADHHGVAAIIPVPWQAPGASAAVPSTSQCLVPAPQGGQICIVTVRVAGAGNPTYFHVDLENRYSPGTWQIINTDAVGKPDELLPSGNEAHKA